MSAPEESLAPRVLVVGCGGIGGTVAGTLSEAGPSVAREVVGFTTNDAIAKAVQAHGWRMVGGDGARTLPGRCVSSLDANERFDWVILATQPPQVEDAARSAAGWLADGGAMVCLQNGLCEWRVAKIVGDERVLGAVVSWGGAMPEPGVYDRTAAGGFTIGRMDGGDDPRLARLAMLLEPIGPVTVTHNLAGARWSKLAINSAVSTLGTIGGDRLGSLMLHISVRRLALRVMTEVVRVAQAADIKLEKVSGTLDLEWLALTPGEIESVGSPSLVLKHSTLLAVGARYRRMRSSMLSAIERGRPPAVDFLNGEVIERGRALGVDVSVNEAAHDLVHEIAKGTHKPGMSLIYSLATSMGLR